MCKKNVSESVRALLKTIWEAIEDLAVWLFASFLLPLFQLFITTCSEKHTEIGVNVYNILFVSIASFLTSVFFVTSFWKQNRTIIRMMLVFSYIIAVGLFILSLVQIMFEVEIFKKVIYECGMYIALVLAILVGFFSKFDEKTAISREIAEQGKNITHSDINGKNVKL